MPCLHEARCDIGAYEGVSPLNPPVTAADSYTVAEGGTLTVSAPGILSNDSDTENDPLRAVLVASVAHGTLSVSGDGSFVYVHDGSETITDSFTYRVNDGNPMPGQIAFVSARDSNLNIYAMDDDGSNQRLVTSDPGNEGYPRWSPNGSRIVFHANDNSGSGTFIYVMEADGTNWIDLGPGTHPDWSPDGAQIVFVTSRFGDRGIYLMDSDGGNVRLSPNPPMDRDGRSEDSGRG